MRTRTRINTSMSPSAHPPPWWQGGCVGRGGRLSPRRCLKHSANKTAPGRCARARSCLAARLVRDLKHPTDVPLEGVLLENIIVDVSWCKVVRNVIHEMFKYEIKCGDYRTRVMLSAPCACNYTGSQWITPQQRDIYMCVCHRRHRSSGDVWTAVLRFMGFTSATWPCPGL